MADTLIKAVNPNANGYSGDDETNLYNRYDISKDIKAARLTPHIGAASRRLKSWVGAAAYEDALSNQPQDELRQDDLKSAEAALAMHFALPGMNTAITPKGIVKTTKEGGQMAGNVVFSYLTPGEVRQLVQAYLEQAEEIARPYMLSDGTPEPEFEIVSE
jgi:hypothetical protein